MRSRYTTAAAIAALTLAFATHPPFIGSDPAFAQGRSDSAPGRGGDGPPGRSDSGPPGQSDSASGARDDGSPGRSGSAPGRGGDGPPGQGGGSPGGGGPGGESPNGGGPGGGDESASPAPSPSPSAPPGDTTPSTPGAGSGPAPGASAPAAPPAAPAPSVAAPSPAPSPVPVAPPLDPQTVGSIPGGGGRGGPDLPVQFLPGRDAARAAAPPGRLAPLRAAPGVDEPVVRVCWSALAAAAQPFGAIYVEAASAGGARRARNGEIDVPLRARVLYGPPQGNAVRESRVTCRLDAAGRVSGLQ